MRRLACLFALLVFPAPALAQGTGPTGPTGPSATPSPAATPDPGSDRIAPGVKAGHVDVGGLLVSEAATKLEQLLGARLQKNIAVAVAGRRFRLTMAQAGMTFDAFLTARRAYRAGVENPPPPAGQSGGAAYTVDVPLAVTTKASTVSAFATTVARAVFLPARNATVKITLRKMIKRRARSGRYTHAGDLVKAIDAAITDPALGRLIKPGRRVIHAKINANDLARQYPTILTVDRAHFKLRVFKRLRFSKAYGVAVGAPGFPTPTGLFRIQNKQVNPVWSAPNKPWAGEFAGQKISGSSPLNPLKARWMGIADGVGIHGTGMPWSIGTRASHGCIRMRVPDVIDLYPRVPVGTPVLIR